ncbi:hypothetical protein L6452_22179 [Arctium lappa]|uniref:Uncharacterized protein n=1 Tax=Arctium lappa TaxID=4217 RepID=A0ACB9AY76_ARCLA|nr:hypothetical protein L6452_22179 [Arctium lappa]
MLKELPNDIDKIIDLLNKINNRTHYFMYMKQMRLGLCMYKKCPSLLLPTHPFSLNNIGIMMLDSQF